MGDTPPVPGGPGDRISAGACSGVVGGDDKVIQLALVRWNCEVEDGRCVAAAYVVDLLGDPFQDLRTPYPKYPSFRYLCRVHFSFDPSS